MIYHCPKCGCELDESIKFCPNCGFEQRKNLPKHGKHTSESSTDEIPLQVILQIIAKHKVLSIIIVVLVLVVVGGYYRYKKYTKEKEAQELVESEVKHLLEITGTYKANNGIKLELNSDGTANITTNNGKYYVGYWREKNPDCPIVISFSDSFKIRIGNKYHDYCNSLYFFQNTLWYDLDAIRSRDFGKCTFLTKE